MLQVAFIRENKAEVVERLSKRIDHAGDSVEQLLALDLSRRTTQTQLDATAAELNTLSKEIGQFFKSGQVEKANLLSKENFHFF